MTDPDPTPRERDTMTENSQKLKDSVVQSAQNSAGIGDGAGDVTAVLSPHWIAR